MTAREVFELALDAKLVIDAHETRLQLMRERIGVQGRALESVFSQTLDPMRKVDDLIDWEISEEAALASSYAAIAEAEEILSGIVAMGGTDVERTLRLVYMDGLSLVEAGRRLGHEPTVVGLMVGEAFGWIDSVGIVKFKEAAR